MQSNDYDMVFWYLASSHFDFWQASIPQPQEAAKRQNTGDFNWPYFDDGHAPGIKTTQFHPSILLIGFFLFSG